MVSPIHLCHQQKHFTDLAHRINVNFRQLIKSTSGSFHFSHPMQKLSAESEPWPDFSLLRDFSHQRSGEGTWSGKPTASTWHWFVLMDKALGQRQSSAAPFLIASIQEDDSGPSSAVEKQEEETEEGTSVGSSDWARKTDGGLLEHIREDTQPQRNIEEEHVEGKDQLPIHPFGKILRVVVFIVKQPPFLIKINHRAPSWVSITNNSNQ